MLKWTIVKKTSLAPEHKSSATNPSNLETPILNTNQSNILRHLTDDPRTIPRRHSLTKDTNHNKRQSGNKPQRRHSHCPSSGKRSNRNKENQCTSTVKNRESLVSYYRFESVALRDVSNITPTNTPPNRKTTGKKRCRSQPHETKHFAAKELRVSLTPPSKLSCQTPTRKKLCLRYKQDAENYYIPEDMENTTKVKRKTDKLLKVKDNRRFSNLILDESLNQLEKVEKFVSQHSFSDRNTYENLQDDQFLIDENDMVKLENVCIEKPLKGALENQNTYASTLPTFQIEYSPCPMRTTQSVLAIKNKNTMSTPYQSLGALPNYPSCLRELRDGAEICPPNKKSRVDNVDDFLQRISSLTSPEDVGMQFTPFKLSRKDKHEIVERTYSIKNTQKLAKNEQILISPLTSKFADLRFSKISYKNEIEKHEKNDSDESDFDELSLDQMVNAILETTEKKTEKLEDLLQVKQNELNETQEENFVNIEQEKKNISTASKKCLKTEDELNLIPDKYFNEREVKTPDNIKTKDDSQSLESHLENIHISSKNKKRKRTVDQDIEVKNISQESLDSSFHLKRQRCVRRKRLGATNITNNNCLTLRNGIPSPNSSCKSINVNNSLTKDRTHEIITVDETNDKEFKMKRQPICVLSDINLTPQDPTMIDNILSEDIKPIDNLPGYKKINKLTSILTLPEGIPSPGTPLIPHQIKAVQEQEPKYGLTLFNGIPSPESVMKHNPSLFTETPFSEAWTPIAACPEEPRLKSRRCLSFNSPDSGSDNGVGEERIAGTTTPSVKSKEDLIERGVLELSIKYEEGKLTVHVIRCRDLYRPSGKPINAYVKVSLIPHSGDVDVKTSGGSSSSGAGLQRTAVKKNSNKPHFDQIFVFQISKQDMSRRLQLAVWHRDREFRRSEFLGCMSFAVKHAIKKDIGGSFKLLSQSLGRTQNVPVATSCQQTNEEENLNNQQQQSNNIATNKHQPPPTMMGDHSQSSVEEIISLEEAQDLVSHDLTRASSKKRLNDQQKVADENLFLRYLELDPTEGPEAAQVALQKKAIGNKAGGTPFTSTKKLTKFPDTGFGFSVVWTHPPRVERVEKGMPAEKAGILPGDYIVFVDKQNVVMMPEVDILNLIRSYGNQLTLEIFRRNTSMPTPSNQNGLVSSSRSASVTIVTPSSGITSSLIPASIGVLAPASCLASQVQQLSQVQVPQLPHTQVPQPQHIHRASTACSTNTTSDYNNRRRLNLPQVTFTSENPNNNNPEDCKRRALYQLVHREQQYSTAMQFSVSRFVAPLAERTDLLAPSDHKILFQNAEDILHLNEEILDNIVLEDGELQLHLIPKIYSEKLSAITTAYKKYCSGLKKADCILVNKTRNTNSEFVRFLHNPMIPRRRPDITGFIHKPLEHYREILKLLQTVLTNTKSNSDDYQMLSKVVQELQSTYRDITSNAGLMEPTGEGRPLLSIQDLESRLVFTRCKPFILNTPGRQWIFGGDLSRVEGRNVRPYWTLLFSDILLFAKVSRDRVLFITEEPLPLISITDTFFNIRKKATEFRINVDPGGKNAESPTAHCGPELSRTPRKTARKRCIILRAPTSELKAVWQNLLQKQIYHVHSGTGGTPYSSPMDSPDVPITSSVVTLQSAESCTGRRKDSPQLSNPGSQKRLDELIEHKCRQLSKSSSTNKAGAIHLAQWIKGQLGNPQNDNHVLSDEEEVPEIWTEEDLKRRSRELNLLNSDGSVKEKPLESRCESVLLSDGSPSKSTTSGSQVTVRSSPLVPESVPVCRQCHKTCLTSNNNNPNLNANYINNNITSKTDCQLKNEFGANKSQNDDYDNEWSSLMLMGMTAVNPAASLMRMDPFMPIDVPKISILPPTPDTLPRNDNDTSQFPLICDNDNSQNITTSGSPKRKLEIQDNFDNEDDDDSPQTDEPPYLVMVPKNPGLKRYGTWSSLGRIPSDELVEPPDDINKESSSEEEEESDEEDDKTSSTTDSKDPIAQSIIGWTQRASSFVAEKMALFEKLGEDSRAALDRYLRPTEPIASKYDTDNDAATLSSGGLDEEYENSGATSGEEVWGTPTSGGELDDLPTFPNSQGDLLSPQDSNSSANCDDDDLMMDDLLMAPPMTAAAIRGLLPRRRLEPLLEEEDTESCTENSDTNHQENTPSPEQDSESGGVADISSAAPSLVENVRTTTQSASQTTVPSPSADRITGGTEEPKTPVASQLPLSSRQNRTTTSSLTRASSYRHILEQQEDQVVQVSNFYSQTRTMRASFLTRRTVSMIAEQRSSRDIEPIIGTHKSKSIRLLDFLSGRSGEKKEVTFSPDVQTSPGSTKTMMKIFTRDNVDINEISKTYSQRPFSPRRQNDKQLDRRFWKQLRRRRRGITANQIPAV